MIEIWRERESDRQTDRERERETDGRDMCHLIHTHTHIATYSTGLKKMKKSDGLNQTRSCVRNRCNRCRQM